MTETERGYHRTRAELNRDALATAARERVFLVAELLDAVAAGADSPGTAFEGVREEIPRWERERDPEWEADWRRRVEHILEWAVRFDMLAVENDSFVSSQ
ncbi:hypothetical protein ACFQER_12385 [Halomicroarcula sp. GCM10025894]|uniref:hypothetical protein n=1 Tax=Halomicroarcula sp. GCM10025894 TaxID=3252673 RepID=UPI0036208B0D